MDKKSDLKEIWNRIAFELTDKGFFAPTQEMKEMLEKDGWSYEVQIIQPLSGRHGMGGSMAVTNIKSPDGEYTFESKKASDAYKAARRAAAAKVYDISLS
jgi:hypothetical protein